MKKFQWLQIRQVRNLLRHLPPFPRVTPYDSLYVEAPPERGIFFRPQVYERIRKSVIWVCVGANR